MVSLFISLKGMAKLISVKFKSKYFGNFFKTFPGFPSIISCSQKFKPIACPILNNYLKNFRNREVQIYSRISIEQLFGGFFFKKNLAGCQSCRCKTHF